MPEPLPYRVNSPGIKPHKRARRLIERQRAITKKPQKNRSFSYYQCIITTCKMSVILIKFINPGRLEEETEDHYALRRSFDDKKYRK
jgi:hypothetical protein